MASRKKMYQPKWKTIDVNSLRYCSLKSAKEEIDKLIKEFGEEATLDFDISYGYYDETFVSARLTYDEETLGDISTVPKIESSYR